MQRLALTVIAVFALFAFAYAETTCERHRQNSRTSDHGMNWDIRCDSEGFYEPMQCTNDTKKWCACYNKEEAITPPSRKITTCVCPLARDQARNSNDASECDVPQCAPTGEFKPKQCCEEECHCVNPETGERNPDLQC
uniref:Putative thyropin n=1 Tax=Dolomedes sulfureus TaxID=492288 RepID=A0A0P0DQK6_9ARAC|nr:putative thyropin precursor [Dolomedes sulfureus]